MPLIHISPLQIVPFINSFYKVFPFKYSATNSILWYFSRVLHLSDVQNMFILTTIAKLSSLANGTVDFPIAP